MAPTRRFRDERKPIKEGSHSRTGCQHSCGVSVRVHNGRANSAFSPTNSPGESGDADGSDNTHIHGAARATHAHVSATDSNAARPADSHYCSSDTHPDSYACSAYAKTNRERHGSQRGSEASHQP